MAWGTASGNDLVIYVPELAELIDEGYTHLDVQQLPARASGLGPAIIVSLELEASSLTYRTPIQANTVRFHWRFRNADSSMVGQWRVPPVLIAGERTTLEQIRRGVGKLTSLMLGPYEKNVGGSDTQHTFDELIDDDAPEGRFDGWWLREPGGRSRRVRIAEVDPPGYTPASGRIVTGSFPDGEATDGEEMELWRPFGEERTPDRVEEATRRARRMLRYEDVHYFVTTFNQTTYPMPPQVDDKAINKVEINTSYLDQDYWRSAIVSARSGAQGAEEPFNWRDAVRWDMVPDGGGWSLSLHPSPSGGSYRHGILARVRFTRSAPPFSGEVGFWPVEQEWAEYEVADELLAALSVSNSLEDRADIVNTRASLQPQLLDHRRENKVRRHISLSWG